ncbi:MAG: biotin--[acetyl-CoA-carboxylase] ligase [Candidatus Izemoplasmatales bacterium]|nr:biotin--[acetyl-CoA-carboxylase] ligase [Candidatus Izemoplasmatales bacterium]
MNHLHFKEIDSTNAYLSDHYSELEDMTVVTTDYQTNGKGRMNRTWYGDESSILCSILLKDNLNDIEISLIPLLIAKSLHQVLSKYLDNIKIKWPNDLLVDNHKLSGILINSIISSSEVKALIIGFGINVNQKQFDEEISEIATSLALKTDRVYDKDEILNNLLMQIKNDLKTFGENKQDIIDYCNRHSSITNKEITFIRSNKAYKGIALGIQENGHLLVKSGKETFTINSGEITLSTE